MKILSNNTVSYRMFFNFDNARYHFKMAIFSFVMEIRHGLRLQFTQWNIFKLSLQSKLGDIQIQYRRNSEVIVVIYVMHTGQLI